MSPEKGRSSAELARSLRLYDRIGTGSGVFVLLLGAGLVVHGMTSATRTLPFLLFGSIIALAGFTFIRFFRRSSTRQQWIQHHCPPVPMQVRIQNDITSAEWRVEIFEAKGDSTNGAPVYRLPIQPPTGDVSSLTAPIPASVYFDPEHGHPTLIETEVGILWGRRSPIN